MTPPIRIPILAMLFFTACAGAKFQAYWKIDQPLYDAIEALNVHPGNTNAQKALPILYRQAVTRHETGILKERFSDHPTRYDRILARLEALQHIYRTLQSVPAAFALVKPKNYECEANRTEGELLAFLDKILEPTAEEREQFERERQRGEH